MGLIGLYWYLTKPIQEGVINYKGCCGGIQAGVHFSETDNKPPKYVSRCFPSSSDGSEIVYNWNGFPCTNKDHKDCCGGSGSECIATVKGGYCKDSSGSDFMYRRGDNQKHPHVRRGNDELLDINDTNDMKDYFKGKSGKTDSLSDINALSPEMQRFMARREKNEGKMLDILHKKRGGEQAAIKGSKDKIAAQNKQIDIITSITIIHLIFLVVFSIVIREEIIQRIDGFYTLLYMQYMKFTGKTV